MTTAAPAPRVVGSLSPSRAAEFLSCPLRFRYRTVDRLPEGSSAEAVRGTLVHQVLEDIFDLPAAERTAAAAHALLEPAWQALLARSQEARGVAPSLDEAAWLASAHDAIDVWFTLERPERLAPAERESFVETVLAIPGAPDNAGLAVRGIIDRLDVAPDGALRVVDYKVAKAPPPGFEARALFQLRIYGLVLWRSRGVLPRRLQLVYLRSGEMVVDEPDEAALLATERKLLAIWDAVSLARETGEYEPHRGRQCDWCAFHAHCPAFGGEVLPMPAPRVPPSRWTRLRRRLRRLGRRLGRDPGHRAGLSRARTPGPRDRRP